MRKKLSDYVTENKLTGNEDYQAFRKAAINFEQKFNVFLWIDVD